MRRNLVPTGKIHPILIPTVKNLQVPICCPHWVFRVLNNKVVVPIEILFINFIPTGWKFSTGSLRHGCFTPLVKMPIQNETHYLFSLNHVGFFIKYFTIGPRHGLLESTDQRQDWRWDFRFQVSWWQFENFEREIIQRFGDWNCRRQWRGAWLCFLNFFNSLI